MKNKSFILGAVILSAAGIFSKILGAIYRIPFARIVGDEGLGIYQMAYPFYTLILAVSTAGVPLAVSKLISERQCQNDYQGISKILRISLILLSSFGVVMSVLTFVSADYIATNILKDPRAALSLKAIAPAILFTLIMANFRGYFQGFLNMGPTAISQILEQLFRVITVFVATYLLLDVGLKEVAAGASFGATMGSFVALIFIIIVYILFKKRTKNIESIRNDEKASDLMKEIFRLAIPITIGALVLPLMQIMDTFLVPGSLQKVGYSTAEATSLYGQLSGMAGSIINLPFMITTSLAASLVPSISESCKLGKKEEVRDLFKQSLKFAMIIIFPATIGLIVLATPISTMLYKLPEAGIPLAWMAPTVLAIGTYQVASGTLQGLGKVVLPVFSLVVGVAVKAGFTYVLIIAGMGIKGAALATFIGYLVAAGLNILNVNKFILGGWLDLREQMFKPVFSVAIMGLITYFSYEYLSFLGNTLSTLISICIGGSIYFIVLIKIKGIKESELENIPKIGGKTKKVLKKIKLL